MTTGDAVPLLGLVSLSWEEKIVFGVPHPLHHQNRHLIRIEGIPRSPLALLRFTRLVSVRE
jgi:hypothetical protein